MEGGDKATCLGKGRDELAARASEEARAVAKRIKGSDRSFRGLSDQLQTRSPSEKIQRMQTFKNILKRYSDKGEVFEIRDGGMRSATNSTGDWNGLTFKHKFGALRLELKATDLGLKASGLEVVRYEGNGNAFDKSLSEAEVRIIRTRVLGFASEEVFPVDVRVVDQRGNKRAVIRYDSRRMGIN